jgi:hypothetical protein
VINIDGVFNKTIKIDMEIHWPKVKIPEVLIWAIIKLEK